jgi:hypothetical protein
MINIPQCIILKVSDEHDNSDDDTYLPDGSNDVPDDEDEFMWNSLCKKRYSINS